MNSHCRKKTMNTHQPFPVTLTFLTLDDFAAELKRHEFGFVRCEAITQDSGGGQAGPLRRYIVDLTAHDEQANEVLACALIVGECWAVFADHELHHSDSVSPRDNLDRAKEIIYAYLAGRGLTPVYTGACRASTTTSRTGAPPAACGDSTARASC